MWPIHSLESEAREMPGGMGLHGLEATQKQTRRRQRPRWATTIKVSINKINLRRTLIVSIAFAFAFVINVTQHRHRTLRVGVAAALTTAQRRAIALSRIKRAMLLSQDAKQNVTAAEEACGVWESVLSRPSVSSPNSSIIEPDVLSLSKTLYASCLVRVGRDEEAVSVYDSCLETKELSQNHDKESIQWRLAKARCLQRLLKYSNAATEFTKVLEEARRGRKDVDIDASAVGASTCILRSSGDVVRARKILDESSDNKSVLLSCCLEYLETGNEAQTVDRLQEALSIARVDISEDSNALNPPMNSFLLYEWILAALKRKQVVERNSETEKSISGNGERTTTVLHAKDLFLELIRINTSPLDDPGLVHLDDKIKLHKLLTRTSPSEEKNSSLPLYWPEGIVFPEQSSVLKDRRGNDSELWISKSRAGYGSHGNQILTFENVRNQARNADQTIETTSNPETEPYLLQRMVDPLMLLEGYKFSLRIYVVVFSSDEAYISSKGLVKLASTPLSPESGENRNPIVDTKMHMTNSGRETMMRQEDLDFLWKQFDSRAQKKDLWNQICKVATDTVLDRYPNRQETSNDSLPESKQVWKTRREDWGIPKILGLDLVVQDGKTGKHKPWLVEVNRFPGLEPRDEDDRRIKYKVVKDAWKMASERLSVPMDNGNLPFDFDATIFDLLSLQDESDTESSLERLQSLHKN